MRIVKLAALVASLGLMASAAQAAVVTITYSGTVKSGTDGAGLFGAAGADLSGLAFSSVFVFDDSTEIIQRNDLHYNYGGTYVGSPSPLISVGLTIDGASYVPVMIGDVSQGYLAQRALGILTNNYYQLLQTTSGSYDGDHVSFSCYDKPKTSLGALACDLRDDGLFLLGDNRATNGVFAITSATMSPPVDVGVSYVPEPGTWALMISGFGMVGGALRRRRPLAA